MPPRTVKVALEKLAQDKEEIKVVGGKQEKEMEEVEKKC